ncbi:hypothetical protein D9M69_477040 [compost metagenome]
MSNYFLVLRASNAIDRVITSSNSPKDSDKYKFYKASDGYLNLYYERKRQATSGQFVDIYSVIPKPKLSETMPLSEGDRNALADYVKSNRSKETVQRMAYVWRVSERTIQRLLNELGQ